MKIYLFSHFWSEFRKRKKKTALITFAIAWGALSLLLLMSFGRGLANQFRVGLEGLGLDLIIFNGGQTSKVHQGLPKGRLIRLYPTDVDLLRRQIPEIKNISAENNGRMVVTYRDKETNRNVNGVESSFEVMRSTTANIGGRFINDDDNRFNRKVVFLGWNLATFLFPDDDPVGKQVFVNRIPFKVIGVMKKKLQMGNYQGLAYDQLYIPFSTFTQLYSQKFVDRIHVQPGERKYSLYIERRVREILGKKYRFDRSDEYAVGVWNTIRQGDMTQKMFEGIQIFMGLIGALTLLIGAVGVTNLMYAIVRERTREIGVKMAMGAKRRFIVSQFLLETLFIFLKGTFWGTVIAFNIVQLIRTIPLSYEMANINSFLLRPRFSLDILLIFIALMGVLVFLSGIFPAFKASKLNPVEALRYE